MAKLKNKVQNALDEGRILILGTQVFLGFQYRSFFEKGFQTLPPATRYLDLATLALLNATLILLLLPGAYHRIVEEGEDSSEFHRFVSAITACALLPLSVTLALNAYLAGEKVGGRTVGLALAPCVLLFALMSWYGLEMVVRKLKGKKLMSHPEGSEEEKTKLSHKIRHVLTEARVVLPGAQALLGFQFATMLMEAFEKLPSASKNVHLASLLLIAISTILLMAPAAYHRVVEEGEETEGFHRFATWMLLGAMVPLGLGVCGDLYVVVHQVTRSTLAGALSACLSLAVSFGLWFGYTAYRRRIRMKTSGRPR